MQRSAASAPPRSDSEDWPAFADLMRAPAVFAIQLAGRHRARCACGTSRISSACTTMPGAPGRSRFSSQRIAAGYPEPGALPDRAHARSARCHKRPGRRAASGGGLPVLSTIHSAKGQEWKSVYVLNAVDGCIPSDMATDTPAEIEEERRLLYVAMTRAKDDLHLIVPHRFYTHQQASFGDRHVYASRTRFIPEAILDRFETRSWPLATARDDRWAWARQCPSISGPACAACGAKSAALGLLLLNRLSGRGVPSGLSGYAAARFSTRRARSDAPIGMIVSSKSYPAL